MVPKLNIFKEELRQRNNIAQFYKNNIGDKLQVQGILNNSISSWAQFSILCHNSTHRQDIIKKLNDNNIPTSIYYITPLHLQKVFHFLRYRSESFAVTEDICSRVLSLPMNPYLSKNEIKEICELILEI